MIPDRATLLNTAGVAAIPTVTSSSPPPVPAPPGGLSRRRAIALIPESDLINLVDTAGGRRRIVGLRMDPMRSAAEVLLEGDDLAEVVEGAEPPRLLDLRYRAPQLVERVDVEGWPPERVHALVRETLLELMEHAGHIGHAAGVLPDLSVNAHAAWIGAHQTATRHAPAPMGAHIWCSSPECQHSEAPYWPCPNYVSASLGVVVGLETAGSDHD